MLITKFCWIETLITWIEISIWRNILNNFLWNYFLSCQKYAHNWRLDWIPINRLWTSNTNLSWFLVIKHVLWNIVLEPSLLKNHIGNTFRIQSNTDRNFKSKVLKICYLVGIVSLYKFFKRQTSSFTDSSTGIDIFGKLSCCHCEILIRSVWFKISFFDVLKCTFKITTRIKIFRI